MSRPTQHVSTEVRADLWHAVKERARIEGLTPNEVLEAALEAYLGMAFSKRGSFDLGFSEGRGTAETSDRAAPVRADIEVVDAEIID